jgi:putative DNA primase/helicase
MQLNPDRAELRREFKKAKPELKHTEGAFAAFHLDLRLKGYWPIALRPGTKKPLQDRWSEQCDKQLDGKAISKLARDNPMAGLGVASGYNCLVGIDIDTDDREIIAAVKAVIPEVKVAKLGQKGFTAFFRSNKPIRTRIFKKSKKEVLVEILGIGRQSVLPPTIHPDTKKPYEWLTQSTLFNTKVEDLPLVPDNIAERIEAALAPWIEKQEHRADRGTVFEARLTKDFSEDEQKRYRSNFQFALQARAKEVAETVKGSRNLTLFVAVCYLGKYIHHGFISRDEFEATFLQACEVNGLVAEEGRPAVKATIDSGLHLSRNDALPVLKDRPRPDTNGERPKVEPQSANPGNEWPEPQRLPSGLPAVASFDFNLLPEKVRGRVDDIATTMQSSPEYAAVSAMTGLGAVIGRKVGIRPQEQTDWTETANLWALLIGRPSVLKSPSMEAALAPLTVLAARAQKEYDEQLKAAGINEKVFELKAKLVTERARKALKGNPDQDVTGFFADGEIEPPVLRRYTTSDSTPAALGELLVRNQNGVLVVRDELVSLLQNLDREENSEGRGLYLTGWGGRSSYTIDRIGRGANLHIAGVCISLIGTTQPGKIARYASSAMRGGFGDDGLIQRFGMAVWPDVSPDWEDVDRPLNKDAKRSAFEVYKRLDEMDTQAIGAMQDQGFDGEPEGIPYLRFAPDAREVFSDWHTRLRKRLRSDELHPAMESHLGKYPKLVPSLALISHLSDVGHGPIGKSSLLRALAWAEYLETHACRLYASVTMPAVDAAKALVTKIRSRSLSNGFSRHDIVRKEWSRLTDHNEVQNALDLLVDLDWLSCATLQTGGRPKTIYQINPRVLA